MPAHAVKDRHHHKILAWIEIGKCRGDLIRRHENTRRLHWTYIERFDPPPRSVDLR